MAEKYYTEALVEALRQEMVRDESVVVMGLDVKASIWGSTRGLHDEFGPERVIGTPVCEGSYTMAAVGAAMTGLRPVVELLFSEYGYLAMETIVNVAGMWTYVSNGGYKIPLVVQTFAGPRGHGAYAHSQSTQASFLNAPGVKIIIPSTPADAKGLLSSAIRDDGPILIFHPRQLLAMTAEVPEGEHLVPIGKGAIRRPGDDATVISFGGMLYRCLDAAEMLEKEGISVEVIDLRTIVPTDEDLIVQSMENTNRLVVVEDGRKRGGHRIGNRSRGFGEILRSPGCADYACSSPGHPGALFSTTGKSPFSRGRYDRHRHKENARVNSTQIRIEEIFSSSIRYH